MTASHKLIYAIFCVSLSIHAMDQNPDAIIPLFTPAATPQDIGIELVRMQSLYSDAQNLLNNFDPKEQTTVTDLSAIIRKIDDFDKRGITRSHTVQFAYYQKASLSQQFSSLCNPPYNTPFHISIFFEQAGQYLATLKKNGFTSPTPEEVISHRQNQIKNQKILTIVEADAPKLDIFIDPKILKERKILIDIPNTSGPQKFERFLSKILLLLQESPEKAESLAELLQKLYDHQL